MMEPIGYAVRDGDGIEVRLGAAAFVIPRAHLAAHYARHDGPVTVYAGRSRRAVRGAGEEGA
jgi:hypothetical protein